MKKILILLVLIGSFWAISASAEEIADFEIELQINKDASINVKEIIKYDFESLQRHGIYRLIPIKYKARGGNYNLRISDIKVFDESNQPYKYKISYPGSNVEIKIGDANIYVTGKHTYIIEYTIKRAINYFTDYDELYWNATGTEWEVPINNAQVLISLPRAVDIDNIMTDCFSGSKGSDQECQNISLIKNENGLIEQIKFSESDLNPLQGLTTVISLPKGLVPKISFTKNLQYILIDNWILIIPLIVFIICFNYWYKRGRDPKGRGTIIAQFDPPDKLSPAEVGTVYDAKTHGRDISAEIINLAIKGYLKINRQEKGKVFKKTDYEFIKLKNVDNKLNEIEQNIMEGLFELHGEKDTVKLSYLRNKFYRDFEAISNIIWNNVANNKYFAKNYKTAGSSLIIIGFVIIFSSISALALFINLNALYLFASIIISAVIIIIFGIFMPKRTKKGALAKEYILGLKEYLTVAEKDRLKFHNAPDKNPQEFERLLPYAIVLGVENEWAKQFADIYVNEQPNWYTSNTINEFSSLNLVNDLNIFKTVSASSLSSNPTPTSSSSGSAGGFSGFSSGGGFSGGGFGGGGGGSW